MKNRAYSESVQVSNHWPRWNQKGEDNKFPQMPTAEEGVKWQMTNNSRGQRPTTMTEKLIHQLLEHFDYLFCGYERRYEHLFIASLGSIVYLHHEFYRAVCPRCPSLLLEQIK